MSSKHLRTIGLPGGILLLALAFILLLAACGKDAESGQRRELDTGSGRPPLIKPKGETTPVPTFTPVPTAVPTAMAEPEVVADVIDEVPFAHVNAAALVKFQDGIFGGTLVIGTPNDVPSLDPHVNQSADTNMNILIHDGAVTRDRAFLTMVGFDEPRVPRMYGLAKTIRWEGSTLVFEFEEGVKFHDGTPFNAEAALFNFRRIWDAEFEYYYPAGAATRSDIGKLVADEGRAMEVRGEYTLAITLKQKSWDFLDWMSMQGYYNFSSPTAIKEFGNEALSTNPVGTGPFKFVEWIPNERIVLEANDDYFRGRPFIDKLIFVPIPDTGARMAAVLSGEIDIAYAVSAEFADEIRAHPDLTLYARGKTGVMEIAPNYALEDSPLQDAKVRKALSHAIDRQGMADILLGGTSFPAASFSSPEAGTYDPSGLPDEFDLEKAKRLLTEAGHGEGFEINLLIPASGCGTDEAGIAAYVQSTWREISVDLNIEVLEWTAMLGAWFVGGADPVNENRELMMLCMGLDSPYRIKNALSDQLFPPGGLNSAHYSNPEVEALLTEMSKAITYEDYIDLARQAEGVARAETSHFWTVWDGKPIAVNSKIKGWKPAKEWGDLFSKAWFEE
jgi:peptide/nickel transport system substrate-binding protein